MLISGENMWFVQAHTPRLLTWLPFQHSFCDIRSFQVFKVKRPPAFNIKYVDIHNMCDLVLLLDTHVICKLCYKIIEWFNYSASYPHAKKWKGRAGYMSRAQEPNLSSILYWEGTDFCEVALFIFNLHLCVIFTQGCGSVLSAIQPKNIPVTKHPTC